MNDTRYTCQDYRQEMLLAGLKNRIHNEDLSPEERETLEEEIRKLESDMGMD
ncbi:MAG: hypothetical protein JRJ78_02365 [Deltaproteobacteria bacterium]|nr:hypothetical protein [Deltaproteobacteria bacterium]MBW2017793.1 hypothetical protein [Deltaproteobacteria bacterium]MBW2305034.1 hypothetical protein [Deltaproteobacteria bacterium]